MRSYNSKKGIMLINTIVYGAIAIILTTALVGWAGAVLKISRQTHSREQAFEIAEAGIDYYRWHLAHAATDYQDGTGAPGPYVHDFRNKDGVVIGQFTLDITPPPVGSTMVRVQSTGTVTESPGISRKIVSQLAVPSFARFAVVANDVMRFGAGTETFGPIHSNNGIRFDGIAHNLVTSARSTYNDPDHSGNDEFGVHTHDSPTDPLPPAAVPARVDVFESGRQFPVPTVDFVGITADLSQMKDDSIAGGRYFAASGGLGYHIVMRIDDTFDLYRVDSLTATPNGCTPSSPPAGWGTWSVNGQTLLGNYANPANGLIFLEDNVWVNGQINTARVTIAAARFPDDPAQRKNIIVNNDLLYTNYDSQDVISLIAQGHFSVGLASENDLRIDAAIIAQNGRVGRYYYDSDCGSNYVRSQITLYGMIGSNQRYGFAYTDGTGYQTRNIIYDSNLLYSPPPSFPLTSDQYQIISWEEIQ